MICSRMSKLSRRVAARWLHKVASDPWPEGVKYKADQLDGYVRALADAYVGVRDFEGRTTVGWDTVPEPDAKGELNAGCRPQPYGVDFITDDGEKTWHTFPSKATILKRGKGDFDAGMESMLKTINAQKPRG